MPVIFALLAGRLTAADVMIGADEKWRLLQSEHFELYSRNSEGESRRLLYNLELVHAIFFETYGFTATRVLPVTVFFFSRDRHFAAYKPESSRKLENIATFYHAEPDRGILTVAPLPSYEAAQQLAFGSYAHHLFRLMGEAPPVWYGYGISGIFRNLVINDRTLELGRPDPQQVSRLQKADLIPVETMLGSDYQAGAFSSDESNLVFHDESWAMIHYLYFGAHKLPKDGVANFISHVLNSSRNFDAATTRQVFEQQVGITYGKFNEALQRYFRSGKYGYGTKALPVVAPGKSYPMRGVSLAEIDLRLAELALRVNRSPQGKLALLRAGDRADAARIQEVLGADAMREENWDQVAERWNRAMAAGSRNPAVLRWLIENEDRQRFSRFDAYYRLPEEAAGQLRAWIALYRELAPADPLSWEVLAWVEATAEAPQIGNLNAVQKQFVSLGRKNRTLLALAWARVRLKDNAGAEEMLQTLEAQVGGTELMWTVELIRAQNEGRPPRTELLAAPGMETSTGFRPKIDRPRLRP